MHQIFTVMGFRIFFAAFKIAGISFLLMMPIFSFAQNEAINDKNKTDDTTAPLFKLTHQRSIDEVLIIENNSFVALKPSESLRLNTSLLEVPQSIQVTTQTSIKEQGLLSTTDILATAAGSMAFYSSGQDAGVMLRGTSSQYNLLRNGIGSGYFFNQELDAAMIERAEFVMGPAGFMISNTDPGGVVNIVTKQPQHRRVLNFNLAYGSWNLMRATMDIGGEIKKGSRFTYRINAGIHHQQQFYKYGYLTKYFAAGVLKYEATKNTNVTFEYNFAHGKSLNDHNYLPTIDGRFFVLPNNFNISDPNVGGVATYDHYFRFNFNHTFNPDWSLNAQLGAVSGAWKANAMNLNSDASVANDTIYRYLYKDDYNNSLYAANIICKGHFYTGKYIYHSLLTGLDFGASKLSDKYDQQYGQQLGLYYPDPAYHLPKDSTTFNYVDPYVSSQRSSYGALYVQDHIKFYNRFILTLAVRMTRAISFNSNQSEENQKDLKITPRLGFIYLFSQNMSAYFVYDQAFLPQIGRRFDGATFSPMTGSNKEIGWKSYWFNNTLNATVAIYNTIRNNVMTADPEHPGFKISEGQIVAKGIEININGRLSKHVNIAANYAYSDVKVTKSTDSTMPKGLYNFGAPVHSTANVFIGYKFINGPLKGLLLGAAFHHADKFNSSSMENDFVGGYNVFDGSAAYTRGKFSIQMNLYNLANAKYITYAYKYTLTDWGYTAGLPRNFRINLEYRL
jgi:iron complex outermembrane receptor protein